MILPVPGCSLIIIGNCPRGLSCRPPLLPKGSFSLIIKSYRSFLSFFNSKVAAGENGSEQRMIGTKWGQSCQAFLLLSVNSWAQVRSQCFSAKAPFTAPEVTPPTTHTHTHTHTQQWSQGKAAAGLHRIVLNHRLQRRPHHRQLGAKSLFTKTLIVQGWLRSNQRPSLLCLC
jgi:hypothetical protein